MTSRLFSCCRLGLALTPHTPRTATAAIQLPLTVLHPPTAPQSTKASPFDSKQSRLSAPLTPPPTTDSSSTSSPAHSSTPSIAASTAYRQPSVVQLENVTQPTPMEYLMYLAVTILSLLAGASVVHNIFKPDMVSTPPLHRLQPHCTITLETALCAVHSYQPHCCDDRCWFALRHCRRYVCKSLPHNLPQLRAVRSHWQCMQPIPLVCPLPLPHTLPARHDVMGCDVSIEYMNDNSTQITEKLSMIYNSQRRATAAAPLLSRLLQQPALQLLSHVHTSATPHPTCHCLTSSPYA